MDPPRITVVTPSFQQGQFLEATIRSVLDQGYPRLEYIVCDGGSTDGSVEIIRRHADRLAWWCSEADQGQSHAINKGLRRATGDVVGWLNSDDLLLSGALGRIAGAFADPAVRAVCGWTITIDESGRKVGRRVYPQPTAGVLLKRSLLPQPSVYWRASLLQEVGYLDESLHVCMDMDYWMRLAKAGVVPRLVREFLAAFRRHGAQKTRERSGGWDRERAEVFRRHAGPDADHRRLKRRTPLGWRIRYAIMKRAMRWGWPPYAGPEDK